MSPCWDVIYITRNTDENFFVGDTALSKLFLLEYLQLRHRVSLLGKRLPVVQSQLVEEPLRGRYTEYGTFVYPVAGDCDVKNLVKSNELYITVRRTYVLWLSSLGREHTYLYTVYQFLFTLCVVCHRKGRVLEVFVTQHMQVNVRATKE
jgi:hypothetical protein